MPRELAASERRSSIGLGIDASQKTTNKAANHDDSSLYRQGIEGGETPRWVCRHKERKMSATRESFLDTCESPALVTRRSTVCQRRLVGEVQTHLFEDTAEGRDPLRGRERSSPVPDQLRVDRSATVHRSEEQARLQVSAAVPAESVRKTAARDGPSLHSAHLHFDLPRDGLLHPQVSD